MVVIRFIWGGKLSLTFVKLFYKFNCFKIQIILHQLLRSFVVWDLIFILQIKFREMLPTLESVNGKVCFFSSTPHSAEVFLQRNCLQNDAEVAAWAMQKSNVEYIYG